MKKSKKRYTRKPVIHLPDGGKFRPRKTSVYPGFLVNRIAEINDKGRVWRF